MQFGFGAPVSGPLSGPRDLARIVSGGEALGYDYCTISDHVMIPRDIEAKYPYSDTGEFPGRAGGDRHEQLTCVAFVAAKTEKLRLVTSVTVVPHRRPVSTAKILSTIDALSRSGTNPKTGLDPLGRLEAGLGRLHRMTREAGRRPSEVGLAYRFSQFGSAIPERADNGDRRLGSGDKAAIAADLRALRDLGVLAVDFSFGGDSAVAVLAEMPRLRADVLAHD